MSKSITPGRDRQFVADTATSPTEAEFIFRIGANSTIILALELDIDIREMSTYNDVADMLTAHELADLVRFVRDLVARRTAGAS